DSQRQGCGALESSRRSRRDAAAWRSRLCRQPMTLKVQSKDGTALSCRVRGAGSPLILVHGAGNNAARWNPVIPFLELDFKLYALDRRGRASSGDAESYALQREVEDVIALVDAVGAPVDVLGHSLGGICAIEAATGTNKIRKLILYEPPIPTNGPLNPNGMVDRLDGLLDAGDWEGVMTTVMRELIGMPNHEIEFLRELPTW